MRRISIGEAVLGTLLAASLVAHIKTHDALLELESQLSQESDSAAEAVRKLDDVESKLEELTSTVEDMQGIVAELEDQLPE